MQASYNHRVLLNDSDIPSLNLVQFASGANSMGYYMYHGGNNPHSLLMNDDPENTLQVRIFSLPFITVSPLNVLL